MQAQIDALLAQVRELIADGERHSATLAEVAQHLPPAQRVNLEATLHGQQLQLGALNSTVNAQQMQLALTPAMDRALDETAHLTAEEASQTAPLLELFQMTHDRLYSRLFQS